MDPLVPSFAGEGRLFADGAALSLLGLGKPPSKLTRGEAQPAKLTFRGRFIERVRGESNDETRDLAELNGNILLGDDGVSVTFECALGDDGVALGLEPTEPVEPDDDVTEEDPREVRLLRFLLDASQFQGLEDSSTPLELALRIDAARFDYCELSVELAIAGAAGDEAVNDMLDVLITAENPTPRRIVTVRFTDETGQAIPNAAVRIVGGAKPLDPADDPQALTADGSGELRLRNVPGSDGSDSCELAWGESADDLRFTRKIFLDLREQDDAADERRLQNLGYPEARTLTENVASFQADFTRPETGRVRDIADDLVAFHDEGTRPASGDPIEPSNEAVAVNDGPGTSDFEDLADADSDQAVALA
jgi:hypothetical protein